MSPRVRRKRVRGLKQDFADLSLVIVCPMANEGAAALEFVDAVLSKCSLFHQVIFLAIIDRATNDDTLALLQTHAATQHNLEVIWAPENRGVVDAYLRGYREALAREADWILEIDAGFSHQPANIPALFQKMTEGYDCVFGSRFCPGGTIEDSSKKRYWISKGGTCLTNLLLGTRLYDMTSGFQLFTRASLQMLVNRGIQSRGPFFQTEMKTYCRQLQVAEVPILYRSASHNVGKAAMNDAWKNLWRLFRLRLSGEI